MSHEEAIVRAFVVPVRRKRYLEFVSRPKNRAKFIAQLAHFSYLDPRFARSIPGHQQTPALIETLLRSKGAGSNCWVVSDDSEIDGKEMELRAALEKTVGYQMGTFLSCIPGKLVYFENEDGRFILER